MANHVLHEFAEETQWRGETRGNLPAYELSQPCFDTLGKGSSTSLGCGGRVIAVKARVTGLDENDVRAELSLEVASKVATRNRPIHESKSALRRPSLKGSSTRRSGALLTDESEAKTVRRVYLAATASLEAASVPALAQLASELHLHAVPEALVRSALRSRADELRHTRMIGRLARRRGGSARPTERWLPTPHLHSGRRRRNQTRGALVGDPPLGRGPAWPRPHRRVARRLLLALRADFRGPLCGVPGSEYPRDRSLRALAGAQRRPTAPGHGKLPSLHERGECSNMPLYLVRWPSLAASLVRAEDEDGLLAILDEAADPGGCTYEIYRGPVWIDFDVPLEVRDCSPEGVVPTDPSDFVVEPTPDFDGVVDGDLLTVRAPETDTADEMRDEVLRGAFPKLAEFIDGIDFREAGEAEESTSTATELEVALREELWPLIEYFGGRSEVAARDDIEASMMQEAGITVMLPAMRRALAPMLKAMPANKTD